jgi:hypothetical protein
MKPDLRNKGLEARNAVRGGALTKIIVFLLVAFAFLALGWMLFLPQLITTQIRKSSGFDATIERLAANPVSGNVQIRGFVLTNPPTFPIADFIELREFEAETQLSSLFSDHPVFDRMVVNAESVTLVKRADGTTNAQALQSNLESYGKTSLVPKSASSRQVLIRRLDLRIDRVVVVDYSVREPTRREFTINLSQTYTDVTKIEQLLAPAALKQLAPVAVAVGGLLPGDVGKVLSEAGISGIELFHEARRRAGERMKGFFDALEESKKP